ncbi:hypothetical protein ACOMHN_003947 [Nucella lapillus]
MATRVNDSDGGSSMTPSEQSDGEERSEHDSDYETDEGKEEEDDSRDKSLNIIWTGYGKRIPVVLFNVNSILEKSTDFKTVGERYHMAFKFNGAECKIIRNILGGHGFHEVHPNCPDFNLIWTSCHLKPFTLRSLTEFQKVNHFPRSSELTRKDRLYKNIQRMQQIKGVKHFDFVPQTYIMPGEYQEFCSQFLKVRGPWIVKPVASSRGRGVFLVNHPDQVPFDENVIVSHYLHNPLVVDGFKFDLRLYVAVTSYDPLVIYLYEEGLTRFATVKYERSSKHIRNQCMHLTNYSVNKKSNDYVKNDDPDVEDYGNKWSMGALLRYLRSIGKDTAALMMRIEDVVIKTLLSVELSIATACKMFMPYRGNCFELYGFDILVDDQLKPWVLEVNLSPSLACDSPLDLKIKGNMLCDLFSLTGIVCHDPIVRSLEQHYMLRRIVCHDPMLRSLQQQSRRNQDLIKMAGRAKTACTRAGLARSKSRPQSAAGSHKAAAGGTPATKTGMTGLNSEEIKILRRVREEEQRKGGWIRIFPGPDTWDVHGPFLQFSTTHNQMLHQRLYLERYKQAGLKSIGCSSFSAATRSKNAYLQVMGTGQRLESDKVIESYTLAMLRASQYERKLGARSKRRKKQKDSRGRLVQGIADDLEDGAENQSEEEYEQIDGRGKPYEVVDRRSSRTDTVRSTPSESSQASSRQSSKLSGETRVQEVKVEAPHPLPASITQSTPPRQAKHDMTEMLMKGGTLSKVQARSAFAMYLRRVKERLMSDTGALMQEDVDALNEQMDLVMRFLKRAAMNLQQTFRVVIPSRKLCLADRRHILAKQLVDFVHVYSRETDQLRVQLKLTGSHSHMLQSADADARPEETHFSNFISSASESELEQMLTTYTKLNKSSSIFLGSSTTSSSSSASSPCKPPHNPLPPPQAQRFELMQRRKEAGEGDSQGQGSSSGVTSTLKERSASCMDSRGTGNVGSLSRPNSASSSAADGTMSTMSAHSLRLGRPLSASNYKPPALKLTTRPSSAKPTPFSTAEPVVDTYNEEAIREALQRLTFKQQTRQYSSGNSSITIKHNPAGQPVREERHRRGSLSPLDEQTHHTSTTHPGILATSHPGILATSHPGILATSRPGSGTSRSSQGSHAEMTTTRAHPPSLQRQANFSRNNVAGSMDYGTFTVHPPGKLPEHCPGQRGYTGDPKSQAEHGFSLSGVAVSDPRLSSQTSGKKQGGLLELAQSETLKLPHPQTSTNGVSRSDREECEGQKVGGRVKKDRALLGKPPIPVKEEDQGGKHEASGSLCYTHGTSQGRTNAAGEPLPSVGPNKQAPVSLGGRHTYSQLLQSREYAASQGSDLHLRSTQRMQTPQLSADQNGKAPMEASKAKHHAMVAQAHAAQKGTSTLSLRDGPKPPHALELSEGSIAKGTLAFSPRPPIQPASSRGQQSVPHRTTRLSSVEKLALTLGVHKSLKYDIHSHLRRKAETNAGH